jgi:recombinational DNA repair ATPase RecF
LWYCRYMDDVLLGIILRRLDAVPIGSEASDLLLAALDSDEALSAELRADGGESVSAQPVEPGLEPVEAYLASLSVSGFRGIGTPATLDLTPGPGLTLVVGRNGSGKSSFAEGLEILLTGSVRRWEKPAPAVTRDSWRNKHAGDVVDVRAQIVIEGRGLAEVDRAWQPGAGLDDSVSWLQASGEKRTTADELGWSTALREYRPFLSHSELEAFFGRPSELHDLLASVLGLDELTAASARLSVERKAREDAHTAIKQRLEPLRERLSGLTDERATQCLQALSGQTWGVAAAKAIAAGTVIPDGSELGLLRRIAQLSPPSAEGVRDAVEALRDAAEGVEEVAGSSAGRALALASLLDLALEHQEAHGDDGGDCPVCGRRGALTAQWRTETQLHVADLRNQAEAAQTAADLARTAVEQALSLMQGPPPFLAAGWPTAGVDVTSTRDAWARWAKTPTGSAADPGWLRELADHLEGLRSGLAATVEALSTQAVHELRLRDDQWAPLAAEAAAWCADAGPVLAALSVVPALKKARSWLVAATAELRAARLAPLADQARAIWAMLRQESNIDLGVFRLASTGPQRKLELDVSIDGTPGAALGVMSQGEVNALALSVFLPRATMPQSPFRFLVIDDPVQAMDPAKVDGLARVLERVAADRQLIVFTHDNRLATAIRDLDIEATILEVTRRPGSIVQVRTSLDPVSQPLADAAAVNTDDQVSAEVASRVVPGLCRSAVEAALTRSIWRQQLRRGRTRQEIETALDTARRRLVSLASLAFFGSSQQGGQVLTRLNREGRSFGDTFQALNRGAHQPYAGDLTQLISGSRRLAAKVDEISP